MYFRMYQQQNENGWSDNQGKKMHLIGREAQDGLKSERKKPNMSLALLVNIMWRKKKKKWNWWQ